MPTLLLATYYQCGAHPGAGGHCNGNGLGASVLLIAIVAVPILLWALGWLWLHLNGSPDSPHRWLWRMLNNLMQRLWRN